MDRCENDERKCKHSWLYRWFYPPIVESWYGRECRKCGQYGHAAHKKPRKRKRVVRVGVGRS